MSALQNLPNFSSIRAEEIENKLDTLLAENRNTVTAILKSAEPEPSWDNLLAPIEEMQDKLDQFWSPISHLNGVMNNEALREVYQRCLPKLSAYHSELGQNVKLYECLYRLSKSPAFEKLDSAQQKVVRDNLLDFKLSGVALTEADKIKFADLQQQASLLMNKFEENLLDATDGWTHLITNPADLSGLPSHIIAGAKENATKSNLEGWLFTLESPHYHAIISYADNAELRKLFYIAHATRASDQGPGALEWDNTDIIRQILTLRYQMARMLGYDNFAELSLVTKMAKTPDRVNQFLFDMTKRVRERAQIEFEGLKLFAAEKYGVTELAIWDIAYYSEKLRQYRFSISDDELRPYFPAGRVLYGLFALVKRLFNLCIEPVDGVDVWHPDAKFFEIRDVQGNLRGQFYLDLYARPHKRGGAWMDDCRIRRRLPDGSIQTPIAFLTCNFTPPTADGLALLNHDEVVTLFHEFGHVLHHTLTLVDYTDVSGINGVEWDAVEFPSQFFENFCWQYEVSPLISGHYQTGEPLPKDLFDRLRAAKNFHSAMHLSRQLEFSLFDFRIHQFFDQNEVSQVQKILNEVRQQVSVVIPPDFNRFQNSFAHIFAGSYGAGYYSYLWAEVLASDAFALFEEKGLFDPETGQSFLKNILEKGGSAEAMELFKNFRGREPTVDAFLHHQGLV